MKQGIDFTGIAVAHFCHDGRGRVLLGKRGGKARNLHGRWDIGAGGVEYGETVEAALNREVREEYGAKAEQTEFLGFRDILTEIEGQKHHWVTLDFKVLVEPAEAGIGPAKEVTEIGWFTLTNLPQPLHPLLPNFLEKYRGRLG